MRVLITLIRLIMWSLLTQASPLPVVESSAGSCSRVVLVLNLTACTPHTHYATDESLEFVEIGSVNRSYQFTYLPGKEENLWPGGL